MWSEKHSPKDFQEFAGNNSAVSGILCYAWKKPLLLTGPCGCGKTVFTKLLAKEKNWEIIKVSDDNIESAGAMAQTTTLFGDKRLIVVDDAELMKKTKEVEELLKTSRNPTIAVSSDLSSKKLKNIKKICEKASFQKPQAATVANHLSKICVKEGLTSSPSILKEVASNAGGDIRAAVNDLQCVYAGKTSVGESDLSLLFDRDVGSDIYSFLSMVYGGKPLSEIVEASWDLSEQPDAILFWVEENMARIYTDKSALCEAMDFIARSDIFLGRIRRRQYWGFLRYASPLMSGGVAAARPHKINYSRYMFPGFYGMLGRTKKDRNLRKSIGLKAAPKLHVSAGVFDKQYINLFKQLISKNRLTVDELSDEFNLSEEEAEYFT